MRTKLFLKIFVSSIFIAAVTSIFVFAWLTNINESYSFLKIIASYIISLISICFVVAWWLERGFFKILMDYDNSIHVLTHDLRNPVTAIKGFLDYILKEIPGPINPVQRKMLLSMNRASLRLLGMINNILDVAKVEAGQMKLELVSLSLNQLSQSVISVMEGMGENKNISFSVTGSEGVMNGDSVLLERSITNLVSNAIKFCPENGMVKISIKEDEKMVYLSVIDNGEGIPPDKLKDVFEKYRQAGQKRSGTGLGLNLCRYVSMLHKGKITVESVLGKGTTFTMHLPKHLMLSSENVILHK